MIQSSSFKFSHHALLLPICLLVAYGIVVVTTATVHLIPSDNWLYVKRQGLFTIIGICAALFFYTFLPAKLFEKNRSMWINTYLLSLFLLLLPLLPGIGVEHFGASRWVRIFGFEFQPSELAKLLLIISMTSFIHHSQLRQEQHTRQSFSHELAEVGRFTLWLLPPLVFFMLQKDFGSIISICFIWSVLQYCYRLSLKVIALIVPLGMLLLGVLVVMEPYRLKRIDSFQAPFTYDREQAFSQSHDAGYQIIQSKIAIVEGGVTGVGVGEGVQKLLHLPKAHNDFVFSTVVEEFGMLGGVMVLILYGMVIIRLLRDAPIMSARASIFSASMHTAIALWIFCLLTLHIGSCVGLTPTKGVTLPFLSYGGSNVVCMLVSIGILSRLRSDANRLERGVT